MEGWLWVVGMLWWLGRLLERPAMIGPVGARDGASGIARSVHQKGYQESCVGSNEGLALFIKIHPIK